LLPRVGKQIAMYGPWIYDIGHCDHPEIHPAEQIWWTEDAPDNGMVYHLSVVADASKRFLWRSQMDDGTKLHPWGAPPITGLFAIAFEVPVDTVRVGTTGQRFDVGNVDLRNAASVPGSSQAHNLVYQGQTLVSFIPHNDSFKVSFENVGLKTGGISLNTGAVVRGFLVIETTVGTVKDRHESAATGRHPANIRRCSAGQRSRQGRSTDRTEGLPEGRRTQRVHADANQWSWYLREVIE
jgi:hypothetical protein